MNERLLIEYAAQIGISLDAAQAALMVAYSESVLQKNQQLNLTAITDPNEFIIKHLLDSLTVANLKELSGFVLDVGTGAGFPGVVLKIFRPECHLMLIDSVNKKIEAIRQMTADIGVEVELMHTRAEEMARITDKGSVYRQAFDCVVARAVAPLNILAEYCLPLVKLNGWFIAMKGATSENEISEATEAVKKTGGVLKRTIDILLPTGIQRTLLIFEKISNTSREYPRATKIIKSRPL